MTELSIKELKNICQSVQIPVVAIGGINEQNIGQLADTGIDGVAVVSALFAAEDKEAATRRLLDKMGASKRKTCRK